MDKLFPHGKYLWQTQTLKNLIRLGIDQDHAYAWSRMRMGGWRVAQSPILKTTFTLKRLEKKGYESLLDYYLKVSSQLNEPLYTRPRAERKKNILCMFLTKEPACKAVVV